MTNGSSLSQKRSRRASENHPGLEGVRCGTMRLVQRVTLPAGRRTSWAEGSLAWLGPVVAKREQVRRGVMSSGSLPSTAKNNIKAIAQVEQQLLGQRTGVERLGDSIARFLLPSC
jgi:hypothetical protein